MCRCASSSRARRSRSRRRTAASRLPSSGASARSSGVRAETLTDRFSRGMRPALSASSAGRGRELAVDLDQAVERLAAARGVAVGLGAGDGRLAEQVDARGHAVRHRSSSTPVASRGVSPTMKRCAMCLTPAAAAAPSAWRPALDSDMRIATCSDGGRSPTSSRKPAEVAREVVERAAGGDDVDEAEQRGPQLGVLRGEVHRLVVDRLAADCGSPRATPRRDRARPRGCRLPKPRGWPRRDDIARCGAAVDARARPGSLPGGPMRSLWQC